MVKTVVMAVTAPVGEADTAVLDLRETLSLDQVEYQILQDLYIYFRAGNRVDRGAVGRASH